MPDHTAGRVRIFIGHDRLYQAWFMGPAGQEAGADTDRFFDAFKLTSTSSAETPSSGATAETAP